MPCHVHNFQWNFEFIGDAGINKNYKEKSHSCAQAIRQVDHNVYIATYLHKASTISHIGHFSQAGPSVEVLCQVRVSTQYDHNDDEYSQW